MASNTCAACMIGCENKRTPPWLNLEAQPEQGSRADRSCPMPDRTRHSFAECVSVAR